MGQQITDKKLQNKKFRKTEKAIVEVFFSNRKILSARVIAKRARISRSTLYRHHKTIYEIIPDYEEYILGKYYKLIRCFLKRNIKVKIIYYQMLIFIIKNKDVFALVVKKGNGQVIEKMIQKIEPKIAGDYKLPKNCDMILKIYEKEIAGVIESWIENDYIKDELAVLANIMYLTETARKRLLVLGG